jgi:endonuclease/exonuclease/phosphatase (EEP) superfamily protein YafD
MSGYRSIAWALLAVAAATLLAACMSLTTDPRALIYEPPDIRVQALSCLPAVKTAREAPPARDADRRNALDPRAIRLLTWNIHKEDDEGWAEDLLRFARASDVLLLQEVSLLDPIRELLQAAGLRWVMASSFMLETADVGVLTATRVIPVASCTQRFVEPLLRIPKSAVITWMRIAGSEQALAVANVHAINFTLSLAAYRAQLAALVDTLEAHEGPLILAGDLNTWSAARLQALRDAAARLRLVEIDYAGAPRTLFLGQQVDHVLVRGLEVVSSQGIAVTSSDHNPVEVVLRLAH